MCFHRRLPKVVFDNPFVAFWVSNVIDHSFRICRAWRPETERKQGSNIKDKSVCGFPFTCVQTVDEHVINLLKKDQVSCVTACITRQ